ncbi:MAG TPA: hypothetical protein VEK32_16055, partial [Thermodesulfobacteriota bacterium]|nr:hypothetical protein [Thermodesulfobacteriota bacterium]
MRWSGNEQDVMVLGSGLAGLVAGTLLSKSNHSVLLLRERGYQSSYSIKGYHFAPFSNLSEKCLKPSLVRRLSQALNLSLLMGTREDGKQAKPAPDRSKQRASFQVILPKARIDIFRDRFLLQKEWRREFPEEALRIEEFYNDLEQIQELLQKAKGKKNTSAFFPFRQRRFLTKMFSSDPLPKGGVDEKLCAFSREFREFIRLQLISRGNFYSDQFPLSLATQVLFDGANESNSDFDSEKLEKEILNQFLRSGGRIVEIEGVKEISFGWRKAFALTPEGNPAVFRSQFLIMNCPLHRAASFLGKKGKGILKWEKKVRPLYMLIPLFVGIDERVVPVGMKDLLVSVLDPERPYDDGNVLFLSLSSKGDKTRAPEGKRTLTVESLMEVEKWGQTNLADYQRRVMNHLYSLFPFLERYIELVDFQWASDHVSRWSYSHFLYEPSSDFYWREGMVPIKMARKICFVGKENFPYLGLG